MRRPRREPAGCEAAAAAYAARGWSPLPIEPRGKRPLVPWLEFQQRIADAGEIAAWFSRWPDANVGIVTGRVSDLVVVDVDAQHGALPPAVFASAGFKPVWFRKNCRLLRASAWLSVSGSAAPRPTEIIAVGTAFSQATLSLTKKL